MLENEKIWILQNILSNVEEHNSAKLLRESLFKVIDGLAPLITASGAGIYTGTITPASEVPTDVGDKVFLVTQPGTYTNFGNVVLPANHFGFIFKNGSSFSIQSVAMPIQDLTPLNSRMGSVETKITESIIESNKKSLNIGGNYYVEMERGSYTIAGVPVDYTTAQPRMRSKSFQPLNGELTIKSTKDFFVIIFNADKRVISNSYDTNGWVKELKISGENRFFKIVSKNTDGSLILDTDLINSIYIERITIPNENKQRINDNSYFFNTETNVELWKAGSIAIDGVPISEVNSVAVTNAIYSTFYKTNAKTITINVNSGYVVGAFLAKSPDYSLNTKLQHIDATSNSITLDTDSIYYVALFIKKSDNSTFGVADLQSAGLVITGLTSTFQKIKYLPKQRKSTIVTKSVESGKYDDAKTKVADTTRVRFVTGLVPTKNTYYAFNVNSAFVFDILVFKGNTTTLLSKDTERSHFNISVSKDDTIVANIYRKDRATIDASTVTGFEIVKVDSEKDSVNFITLNGKLNKDIFSVDEYGLDVDATDNSDALNNLIEYLERHGGGTILFPQGIFNFGKRVWAKSGINIQGVNRHRSILKMFGNSNFSLFDNGERMLYNATFKNFTIDGYNHLPTTYSTDGKGFNFHNAMDCEISSLTVKGTDGTGIGTDFLIGTKIFNNHVIECGKGWKNQTGYEGGSGIGIGTGWNPNETFIVSNNIVEKCGQNGIFIEDQGIWVNQNYVSRGQIVANNTIRDGRKNGLAIRGNTFVNFNNNLVYKNVNGLFADLYAQEVKINNNQFILNSYGIYIEAKDLDYETKLVDINSNQIIRNTTAGIRINADNTRDINLMGNTIQENAQGLVVVGSGKRFTAVNNVITQNTSTAVTVQDSHEDFIFKNNIVRGAKSVTATFTGETTMNDLI